MNDTSKLYLKQFFNNHATKISHKQELQVLAGSMEVLHQLVVKFVTQNCQHLQGLPNLKSTTEFKRFKGTYGDLHATFSQLYKELSGVFKIVSQKLGSAQLLKSSREKWQCNLKQMQEPFQQDELYGILNEYKLSNKKLKEQKRSLESKLSQKDITIINLEKELQEKSSYLVQLQTALKQSQKDIKLLQGQIEGLQNHQKQFLSEKANISSDVEKYQQIIGKQNQEVSNLRLQVTQLQSKLKSCELKIKEFPIILNEKVAQVQHKISIKIAEKMNSKENWQQANANCLKKIISYTLQSKQ